MMNIGDKVWIIDQDRRVYVDKDGNKSTYPIFREKFVERFIVGETRVSWLIDYSMNASFKKPVKIKKADAHSILYASEKEVEQRCWVEENRYKISERVRNCQDYETLSQIVDLLKVE